MYSIHAINKDIFKLFDFFGHTCIVMKEEVFLSNSTKMQLLDIHVHFGYRFSFDKFLN